MEHISTQVLFASVVVASTGSVEGPIIDLSGVGPLSSPFAISLRAASVTGTADVKVQVHSSEDGVNFSAYADHPSLTDSTLLSKPNGPELFNEYPLADVLNKYMQLKVTGVASNPADTVLDAKLLVRELI